MLVVDENVVQATTFLSKRDQESWTRAGAAVDIVDAGSKVPSQGAPISKIEVLC